MKAARNFTNDDAGQRLHPHLQLQSFKGISARVRESPTSAPDLIPRRRHLVR
jgi:hypothetical protein